MIKIGLPDGEKTYVYRDDAGAEVCCVIRQPAGSTSKYLPFINPTGQRWECKGLGDNRPLYNLPEILSSDESRRIMVVEGEKCADAVRQHWHDKVLSTTWMGGAKAHEKTDFSALYGRSVILVADADEPGREAMQRIAKQLCQKGCAVKIYLPQGTGTDDVADWLADDPEAAYLRIKNGAVDFTLQGPPEKNHEFVGGADALAPVSIGKGFLKVLGLVGAYICIQSLKTNQIHYISLTQIQRRDQLIAIAPEMDWASCFGASEFSAKNAPRAGDSLIREAEEIGAVDVSKITGRGAFMKRGVPHYHAGKRIVGPGLKESPVETDDEHVMLDGPEIKIGKKGSPKADLRNLAEALGKYRFRCEQDCAALMGWTVLSVLAGALEWRPHVWLTGSAGCGKSWIIKNVVEELLGSARYKMADASAAGLSARVRSDALGVIIEEGEPDKSERINKIIEYARIAAGGDGERVRSTKDGTPRIENPRFPMCVVSTTRPRLLPADESRFFSIQMDESPRDNWAEIKAGIEAAVAAVKPGFIAGIILDGAKIIKRINGKVDAYSGNGLTERDAIIRASLETGWEWLSKKSYQLAIPERVLQSRASQAERCFMAILQHQVRDDTGAIYQISELIRRDASNKLKKYGRLNGVMSLPNREKGGICIAINHITIEGIIKKLTSADIDYTDLFCQLPGAYVADAIRFCGIRARAVVIPESTALMMGMELDTPDDEM